MITIQAYINECLACAERELFKYYYLCMQEKQETAQKLIYLFSAADMIYEGEYK